MKLDGKCGHIDPTGKMVVPLQFSEAFGFSEGLAEVKDGNKWGYIDKTGQMVIPPAHDMAHKQAQGLAAVKTDGKWGYVDKKVKMLIPPQYEVPIDTTYRELGVNVGSYLLSDRSA